MTREVRGLSFRARSVLLSAMFSAVLPGASAAEAQVRLDPPAERARVAAMLADPASAGANADAATRAIATLLEADPVPTAASVRASWGRALLEARKPDHAAEVCQRAILAAPGDATAVEALLQIRVRGLLAAKRPREALGAARQLFAISSMSTTGHALLLVAECLGAANPEDAAIVDAFRREQTDGAARTATASRPAPSATAGTRATASAPAGTQPAGIMLSIEVDGRPFEAAARKLSGEDFAALVARGNLWLLANEPGKAREVYRRAYTLAPDAALPGATENLARVLKAEHGTVGPANEFILALRPPATTRPPRRGGT